MVLCLGAFWLTGCSDNPEVRYDYVMPQELEGCKVVIIKNGKGGKIKVVTCPRLDCTSSTYSEGKTTTTTAICKG